MCKETVHSSPKCRPRNLESNHPLTHDLLDSPTEDHSDASPVCGDEGQRERMEAKSLDQSQAEIADEMIENNADLPFLNKLINSVISPEVPGCAR